MQKRHLPISYPGAVAHPEETDPGTQRQTEAIRSEAEEEVPEAKFTRHPEAEATAGTIPASHPLMKRRKVPDSHPITGLTRN